MSARAWRTHQSVLDHQFTDGNTYPHECAGLLRVEEDRPPMPMLVRCDRCHSAFGVFRGDGPGHRDFKPRDSDKRAGHRKKPHDDDAFLGAT